MSIWGPGQWRRHGGGVLGSTCLPPLTIGKEMKTFFGTIRLCSYKDCRHCYHVFLYYPPCLILKNFNCDAIIPEVKLSWCVTLDVADCRKSETFLF